MNVLVTGGAGFIGSHVVEALLARGDRVAIVDRLDAHYDPAPRRARVPAAAELHERDILDTDALVERLRGVDAVIHLAARPGVRESLVDPMATVRENVLGTSSLLRAMDLAGVRRLVFASSSSVYGARRGEVFREADPADRPESPYGASKRAGELLCHAAHVGGGLDVTCARLFTVYGPRQRPGMAIARFVRAIRAGDEVSVFGDGRSLRDYTFVSDVVAALLAALERSEGYRVVNVGGGAPVRLDGLLDTIARVLDRPLKLRHLPDQPGDVPETRADLAVARAWLDWAPAVPLEEGLRRYVAWLDAGEP